MHQLHRTFLLLLACITGCASSSQSNGDDGDCSVPATHATIADAVADASCWRIAIEPGTYSENLVVEREVALVGTGPDQVILDGGQRSSTITIAAGANVRLHALAIRNGLGERGGGIANRGTLALHRVHVEHNAALGALAQGGGIYSTGSLAIDDSAITDNTASTASTTPDSGANGAGIYSEGALALTDTIIAKNAIAVTGMGPQARGAGVYAASMTAISTLVENNTIEVTSTRRDFRALGAGLYLGGTGAGDSSLTGVEVRDNRMTFQTTDDDGGTGGGAGIAVDNARIVTIDASTLASNEIVAGGHDIAGVGAGLLWTPGGPSELDIRRTTIADNTIHASFPRGGGIGVVFETGRNALAIEQSTISANHAIGTDFTFGGGIDIEARNDNGHNLVALRNSTISGNALAGPATHFGGGVHVTGVADNGIELELASSTITNNSAPKGTAGLHLTGIVVTFVRNTILAQNTGLGDCSTDAARFSSEGFNLFGDVKACLAFPFTGDLTNADALLAPLADNGGPTRTHAARPGSPAIDHGDPAGCSDGGAARLTVDQRGTARIKNGRCDIGAFEN